MPTAPIGQDDLYVRTPQGEFRDIGPMTPPADGPTSPPAPEGDASVDVKIGFIPVRGASADLSHVLFNIFVTPEGADLWPGDETDENKESLYEYVGTGNTTPVLVGVNGGYGSTSLIGKCGVMAGGPASNYNALSEDGATVLFTVVGHDAGPCARTAPPVDELYARSNQSETVKLSMPSPSTCTTSACTSAPAADALFEGASRSGARVFFTSTQQLTDDASEDANIEDSAVRDIGSGCPQAHESGCNLYEYDFEKPLGQNLVSITAGSPMPHVQGVVRISQDGSHVYFVAQGQLSSVPNRQGQTAKPGEDNLYMFEHDTAFPDGRIRFIAALAPEDSEIWGGNRNADVRPAQATPDGRVLVFQSHARLTPDDTSSGVWQVFKYDAQTEMLNRVSIGQDGFNNNGNTSISDALIPTPDFSHAGYMPQFINLSDDGAYIFFQSATGLTPEALSDVAVDASGHKANNVYEYHDGQVYLISDGQDVTGGENVQGAGSSVRLVGTSASGADVFFTAGDQLNFEDIDTQQDIYDARIGGGFMPSTSFRQCLGEACQGAPSSSPPILSSTSASLTPESILTGPIVPPSKPKTPAQIRGEKLAKALKSCRVKHNKHKRAACESEARRRFGVKSKAKNQASVKRKGK